MKNNTQEVCQISYDMVGEYSGHVNITGIMEDYKFWLVRKNWRAKNKKGQPYSIFMEVKELARLLNVGAAHLKTCLDGDKDYFPRKYIGKVGAKECYDLGNIYIMPNIAIADKKDNISTVAMVPYESIWNIVYAYSVAALNEALKGEQKKVGRTCIFLLRNLFTPDLKERVYKACGFNTDMDYGYNKVHVSPLYEIELPMLTEALNRAYPDREEFKYEYLSATVFGYAYKFLLGKNGYKEIKKVAVAKSTRVYNLIKAEEREKLKVYVITFANMAYQMHRHEMLMDVSKNKSKLSLIKDVTEYQLKSLMD
jgi:hypothetical protein